MLKTFPGIIRIRIHTLTPNIITATMRRRIIPLTVPRIMSPLPFGLKK